MQAEEPTERPPARPRETADIVDRVPVVLRVAAAYSWRLIVVGIIAIAAFRSFTSLAALTVPIIVALIIAAPMERLVARMEGWHIKRGIGAAVSVLGLVFLVVGLLTGASTSIVSGFGDLQEAAVEGFDTFIEWLVSGPIHMSQEQIDQYIENVRATVEDNAWGLASGALSVGSTVGGLFAGTLIALIGLFFFLRDGRTMWLWIIGIMPVENTDRLDRAGLHGWNTLRRYTQTTVFVAFVDAVGIGVAAAIIGVPLAFPLAILVFLFSFIPLFGATLSGAIATLVALVDGGLTSALWMLAAVLLVQQLEGNVLYPWLFGKAASIHPLVILLTVSAGTLMLGLVGAVIAVPILATGYAFIRGLREEYRPGDEEDPPITSQVPVIAERSREAIRRARQRMSRTGEITVRGAGTTQAPVATADEAPETETHSEQIVTRKPRDVRDPDS
ncbi:AI-2E family transporter [Demequina sp.]|uniref:AI-2E family transporter n=1 Tax=Demequina sp. TaxID=2050685 RepID=UPI003A8617F1